MALKKAHLRLVGTVLMVFMHSSALSLRPTQLKTSLGAGLRRFGTERRRSVRVSGTLV
jgi:hypothetical protein